MSTKYRLTKFLSDNCHVPVQCALCPPESESVQLKYLRAHVSSVHAVRCHRSCHFCFGQKVWQKGDVISNSEVTLHRLQCVKKLLQCSESDPLPENVKSTIEDKKINEDTPDTPDETVISQTSILWQKRMKHLQNAWLFMEQQLNTNQLQQLDLREQLIIHQRQESELREQLNIQQQREAEFREQLNIQQQREAELREHLNIQQQREAELREQLNIQQQREAELREQLNIQQQREAELREQLNIQQQREAELQAQFSSQQQWEAELREQPREGESYTQLNIYQQQKTEISTEVIAYQLNLKEMENSEHKTKELKEAETEIQRLKNDVEKFRKGWQNVSDELQETKKRLLAIEQRQILQKTMWK